jgi:hypothetical protein
VADKAVVFGVRPTLAAEVGPGAGVPCHFPRNRPPFLAHYAELHHADVSLLLNKKDGLQLGLVQRCDGARGFMN